MSALFELPAEITAHPTTARGEALLEGVSALTPEQFTRDMGSSFRSVRDTCAHTYAAEWAWYSRWHGNSPTSLLPADQFPDVDSIRTPWMEHEGRMRAFLDELGEHGVGNIIEYKLLNGASGASPFWQMLQHIVNHGSYHRGEVGQMLKRIAAAPPRDLFTAYLHRAEPQRREPV